MGNVLPDGGVPVMAGCGSTASTARAAYVTRAPAGLVASTAIGDGGVRSGAVVSRTVTVKLAVALLPEASRAVQSTSVEPSGKVLPDAGRQLREGLGSWSSVAVVVNETTAPLGPVASATTAGGTDSVGGVVSRWPARVTVMVVSVLVAGMVKGVGARLLPAGGVTVPLLGLRLVVVGSQRRLAWPLLSVLALLVREPLVIV